MKIIKFYTDHCVQCKALEHTLSQVRDIEIEAVNAGESDLGMKYGIRNVPTLVFVDNEGNELGKMSGNVPLRDIQEFIKKINGDEEL